MIRLPPSRILLTETDINHHLQRILVSRAIITTDFGHSDIDNRHGDLFTQPDGLPSLKAGSIPSPLSPLSTSTCTIRPQGNDDVEYDEEEYFYTSYGSSSPDPQLNHEKDYSSGQRSTVFLDGVTGPSQLVDFGPSPDPYQYGMDIAGDGRISARRRVERISWPSARNRGSGSSLPGREGFNLPSQNMHLDTTHPGAAFSNDEIQTSSSSSNRSTRTRRLSSFRDPNPSLAEFRSSASGTQLDGHVAGSSSQHLPLYRHSTVRKSSRLRIAHNATTEQSSDEDTVEDTVDEAGPGRIRERDSLSHQPQESISYHYRSGSYPCQTSDAESSEVTHAKIPTHHNF